MIMKGMPDDGNILLKIMGPSYMVLDLAQRERQQFRAAKN
jgi:hypothetical protein